MLHVVALYISFHPAAISFCCGLSLDKQMSMETTDTPSASADNHGAPGLGGSRSDAGTQSGVPDYFTRGRQASSLA